MAADAMRHIQLLYQSERNAKNLTSEQRYDMRQQRSVQVLNDFRKWLDQHLMIVPPKSALGKAMNYADKR